MAMCCDVRSWLQIIVRDRSIFLQKHKPTKTQTGQLFTPSKLTAASPHPRSTVQYAKIYCIYSSSVRFMYWSHTVWPLECFLRSIDAFLRAWIIREKVSFPCRRRRRRRLPTFFSTMNADHIVSSFRRRQPPPPRRRRQGQ